MSKEETLKQLVEMSNRLGDPSKDYVILGEGNTSAKVSDETFFVKGSGTQLSDITESGFVEVYFRPVLEMLKMNNVTDDDITRILTEAKVDKTNPRRPSVETMFHAMFLSLDGVNFVGHTHPTAVNSILCSQDGFESIQGRLFPDEIVCCGLEPVFVPYTDPGVVLAKTIKNSAYEFIDKHGFKPKAVLMQNHGLVAIGSSAKEVESITAMWVKTARVILGTRAMGGPRPLSDEQVARIFTRPDEKYREKGIAGI